MKKSRKFFASLLVAVLMAGTSQADITISSSNSPYELSGTIADNIIFDSGTANTSAATTLNGALSGTGIINKTGERGNWLQLNGNNSNFSGTVKVAGNTWVAFLNSQSGSAKAVWNLSMTDGGVGSSGSGLLLQSSDLVGKTIELGDLTGNGLVRPGDMIGTVSLKVGALGNNSTFSGIIRDNSYDMVSLRIVNVNKVGTGTWTLTGANTFSGLLTVSDGTVQLGDYNVSAQTGGASGTVSSSIALDGGTLAIAQNADYTINNTFTKLNGTIEVVNPTKTVTLAQALPETADSFSKTGTGTLLLKDTQQFTGTIDSTGGTIVFTGQRAFEGGSQKKLGNVSVTDGTLRIQTSNPFGAGAYLPNLVTLTDSTMINANGAGVNTNFGNILLSNGTFQSGALATTTDGRSLLAGKITTAAGTNNYMTGQFVFRQDNYAIREDSKVQSGIFDIQGDSTLTWTGATIQINGGNQTLSKNGTGTMVILGKVWDDVNSSLTLAVNEGVFQVGNYSNDTNMGSADFLKSGRLTKVSIGANGTLRVDSSTTGEFAIKNTYDFTGGGTLEIVNPDMIYTFRDNPSVSGDMVKTGAGIVAFGTDNVSGLKSVTVKEGTLKNWGVSRLGNGSVKIKFDGGVFMEATKDLTLSNPIEVLSTGTITPEKNDTAFTLSGIISGAAGTTLTKTGEATVTISNANNTFAGTFVVKEGTIVPGAVNAFKTAIVQLDGGRLVLSNNAAFAGIDVADNGGSIYTSADLSPSGKLTGTGELIKTSNNRGSFLRLTNLDISEFAGTLTTEGSTWIHLSSKSSANATLNLANTDNSGFLFNDEGRNYNFGNLTGTGWMRGNDQNGTFTITVGAKNVDGTFSGAFKNLNTPNDVFNVTKTGTGTWTLASENQASGTNYNNYHTNITVEKGTLELARNTNQISADNLTLKENAVLLLSKQGQKINGTFTNEGGEILVDLAAFESPEYVAGKALLTTNGTVTGVASDDLQFLFADEITRQTEVTFKPSDIISGLEPEIPAASLATQLAELYNVNGIPLLDVMSGADGSLIVSFNSAGVPEPSTWVLLVLGSLGLVCLKRRKR